MDVEWVRVRLRVGLRLKGAGKLGLGPKIGGCGSAEILHHVINPPNMDMLVVSHLVKDHGTKYLLSIAP